MAKTNQKIKISERIQIVESMDIFDKLLIWNHKNVNNLYHRTKLKLSGEKDHWADYKIDWKTFNQPYITEEIETVITMNKGKVDMKKEKRLISKEKEIHRWYHLFKTEIFNGRKV